MSAELSYTTRSSELFCSAGTDSCTGVSPVYPSMSPESANMTVSLAMAVMVFAGMDPASITPDSRKLRSLLPLDLVLLPVFDLTPLVPRSIVLTSSGLIFISELCYQSIKSHTALHYKGPSPSHVQQMRGYFAKIVTNHTFLHRRIQLWLRAAAESKLVHSFLRHPPLLRQPNGN